MTAPTLERAPGVSAPQTAAAMSAARPSAIQAVDLDSADMQLATAAATVDNESLNDDLAAEVERSKTESGDSEQPAAAPSVPLKVRLAGLLVPLRPALRIARGKGVLIAGCLSSLISGVVLASWLRPPAAPALPVVSAAPAENPSRAVFAVATRRHEPIQPLSPIEDLDPQIVELGKRLFHEPGLSATGRISCASCHPVDRDSPQSSFQVSTPGDASERYNAPTILNAALNVAQHWEGRYESLEAQLDVPITDPAELGSSWERVTKFLTQDRYYRETFRRVMETEPTPDSVKQALATYERSLITCNSKFDQWLMGTEKALGSDEYCGYYLFKKFNCISCHQGPAVGGTMFQPLGKSKAYFTQHVRPIDLGRFQVTEQERDRHVFRVPTLRNVELTAPYFHDGSVASLEEAVALMIEYQCGEEVNQEDVRRITAFLKSLTGELKF